MSESFLGRWSRRKQAPAEAVEAEDERIAREQAQAQAQAKAALTPAAEANAVASPTGLSYEAPPDLPAIESLTKDADFSPFMKPEVPPQLKNAALKKLFSDPHFNVMDGLDIYIDDYTKEDPIPEAMLRSLTQSRALGLFDYSKEEAAEAAEKLAREQVEHDEAGAVAESADVPAGTSALPDVGNTLQPKPSTSDDAAMQHPRPASEDGAAH
jgi:hypothetical protein